MIHMTASKEMPPLSRDHANAGLFSHICLRKERKRPAEQVARFIVQRGREKMAFFSRPLYAGLFRGGGELTIPMVYACGSDA